MIIGLVEGLGDLKSLPHLLSKASPIRRLIQYIDMEGKSNIVRENEGFEKTIIRQINLGFQRFFILMDADVYFFPYSNYHEEVQGMTERISELLNTYNGIQISAYWAIKNYESWLIGGLSRGNRFCNISKPIRGIPGDTQAHPQVPKEWIKGHLSDGRYGTDTQVCLTKHLNLNLARQRNNSLRVFLDSL